MNIEELLARSTWVDEYEQRWVNEDIEGVDLFRALRVMRKHLPTAQSYLETRGEKFPWAKTWLKYGRTFPTPTKKLCQLMFDRGLMLEKGHCHFNALVMSNDMRSWTDEISQTTRYVEGIAVCPMGAHPHSWVVVGGRVLDPTWTCAYMTTYYGVSFEPDRVQSVAKANGFRGITSHWDKCGELVIEHLESRSA
ncbi:MAG: hypothetical protein WC444_00165 [Candidatus Paceibacterota bacterium]